MPTLIYNNKQFKYFEPSGNGKNFTSFRAQPQSSDIIYDLPTSDGINGQVLCTNGNCRLSWTTPSVTQIAGSGTELQYRNNGNLGAITGSSFASNILTIPRTIIKDQVTVSYTELTGGAPHVTFVNSNSPAAGASIFFGNENFWSSHANRLTVYAPAFDVFADGNQGAGQIRFYTNSYDWWSDTPKFIWDEYGNYKITSGKMIIGSSSLPTSMLDIVISSSTTVSQKITLASGQSVDGLQVNPYSVTAGTRARITSVGEFSNTYGYSGSEIFGAGATAGGNNATVFGNISRAGQLALALGRQATSDFTYGIAIGYQAITTASQQLVFGQINDIYFNGVTSITPTTFTINATGGSGTDIAGGNISIAGGKGTGNASGGSVLIQTSDAGSSGATLQSLTTKLSVVGNNIIIGGNTTASELRFLEPSGSGTNYTAFKAQAQIADVTYTLPAADGSSGQVLSTNGSGTLSWATVSGGGGGGGLTYFTESQLTANPNNTVYESLLTATGATTDIDVVITPKGVGAFQLHRAGTSWGNKRGANAVDLQTIRTTDSNVASGQYSVTLGAGNTASGSASISSGGQGNNVSGQNAANLGGSNSAVSGSYGANIGGLYNTCSGSASVIAGGMFNTLSGSSSFLGGSGNTIYGNYSATFGSSNNLTGNYSFATGFGNVTNGNGTYSTAIGFQNSTNKAAQLATGADSNATIYSAHSHAAGRFNAVGDAQTTLAIVRCATTNATTTELFVDGASATERLILPANTTWSVRGTIVARSSTDHVSWNFTYLINRNGSNSTTSPGSISNTPIRIDYTAGASTWTCAVSADDTNESLKITGTGAAATNIKWVARVELTEVAG